MSPILSLILKMLIPLLGDVITQYVMPLINPSIKGPLEKILPIAERWVAAVETTNLKGAEKQAAAVRQIINQLKEDGLPSVELSLIQTAIQLAYHRLGLDKTSRVIELGVSQ